MNLVQYSHIFTVFEPSKDLIYHWVIDFFLIRVFFQMSLSYVGGVVGMVDEYMVPRSVLRRSRLCDMLVPFFTPLEADIDLNDDSSIVELIMLNQLAYSKFRKFRSLVIFFHKIRMELRWSSDHRSQHRLR